MRFPRGFGRPRPLDRLQLGQSLRESVRSLSLEPKIAIEDHGTGKRDACQYDASHGCFVHDAANRLRMRQIARNGIRRRASKILAR